MKTIETSLGKLKLKYKPDVIASQMVYQQVYNVFLDGLIDIASDLQRNSYVGATKQLKSGWDVNVPRRGVNTYTEKGFYTTLTGVITNNSSNYINRVAGRPPGGFPPLLPLQDWVKVKITPDEKKSRALAYVIGKTIAQRGTKRYQSKVNFMGIDHKGNVQPNKYIDIAYNELQEKIKKELNLK